MTPQEAHDMIYLAGGLDDWATSKQIAAIGLIIDAVMKCTADAVEDVHTSGLSDEESEAVCAEFDAWQKLAKELQK